MPDAHQEYTTLRAQLVAASRGHSLSADRALMERAADAIEELMGAAPTYRFDVSQETKLLPAVFVRALVTDVKDEFLLAMTGADIGAEYELLARPVVEAVLLGLGLKVEPEVGATDSAPPAKPREETGSNTQPANPTPVTVTEPSGGMVLDDAPPAITDTVAEQAAKKKK